LKHSKESIRQFRLARIKLMVEILELERRVEMAYTAGPVVHATFIKEAENLIAQGKAMLEKLRLG
jgi:hypothetical protein